MVHNLDETVASTASHAVAFDFYFLPLEHALRKEDGTEYKPFGRWLLAAVALLGWAAGFLFVLPYYTLALLIAFVFGAAILNNAVMELSPEKFGRFLLFLIGRLLYGLILLPLG